MMTEASPTPARPGPGRSRPTPKRGHAAQGARIVVAGLAAGTGLGLIGAMSAAARSSAPTAAPAPVRRVIVVDPLTGAVVTTSPDAAVVAEPSPLPSPAPFESQPAPPVTQSQGS